MASDAMISLQCSSSEKIALDLNSFLRSKGVTTWICVEMQGGASYREEIVVNASGSKALIALMNVKWAESKECRYEFNIALRTNLTKGNPTIVPVILENFDWNKYPLLVGVMANTNAIFYNAKDPQATWAQVLAALASSAGITPGAATGAPEKAQSPDVKATPQTPENISEWNSQHVVQWLKSRELTPVVDTFVQNLVDGPILLEIKSDDLIESLKLTPIQVKRITREISALIIAHGGKASATQEPQKDDTALRSTKGFKTGVWEGHYTYSGGRDPTSMDVTMIAGVVAGYGSDLAGDFLIQGTYDDHSLAIGWDKGYVGAHTIVYSGKLHQNTIQGRWEEKGDPDNNGLFALTFKENPHKN